MLLHHPVALLLNATGWNTCPDSGDRNPHPSRSQTPLRQAWLYRSRRDDNSEIQNEVAKTPSPNSHSPMRDVTTSPTVPSSFSSSPGVFKPFPQHPAVCHNRQPALLRVDNKTDPNANTTDNANTTGNANAGADDSVNGSTYTTACAERSSPTNAARQDEADNGGAKQRTQRTGSSSPLSGTMSRNQTFCSNIYLHDRRSVCDLRGRRPSDHIRPVTNEPMQEASCAMIGRILWGTLVN